VVFPPDGPKPAGFGRCPECAYAQTGTAEQCFTCARGRMERLAPLRCSTCDQKLQPGKACGNPLCKREVAHRGWECISAIAMRSGPLSNAISVYKYDGVKGWAWIFGRILVGYLESDADSFDQFDVIIPMPTYVGAGGRPWDHVATIIERAEIEGPRWPFRREVMRKTAATPRLVGLTFAQRAQVVERELAATLEVVDPASIAGKHVLVFDDVFTSGLTLREVAFKLKAAGARSVAGIVLARQPYSG
jgi:predicted amidophosphoribosyltransferase